MRVIQSAWLVVASLSGLTGAVLPIVCKAESVGPASIQQLQQQIVADLAKGKDVSALITQIKSLPATTTATRVDTRRDDAAQLQQQLLALQQALRTAAGGNTTSASTLSAVADAYQALQANHLLFKQRFVNIKQTLANANLATTYEARRQTAEANYDQLFKGLTDILDASIGALSFAADRTRLLADSGFQNTARDAIRQASDYLDSHVNRPVAPILRASTLLPYRQAALAQRQPVVSPVIQPSYLNSINQANPPQPADSMASLDAPLADEILAQAKSLGYDYIRIYEFVRNNIRTQWYAGAMKGAVGTLRQKSGNDIDQASLLIALFRASGLPSRYVHGVVELPIEDVMNSLGVNDATQATTAFTRAGVAYSPVVRGGRIAVLNVEHTWVSAYVPYTNYRGAMVDASGATWLPLTPALKANQIVAPTGIFAGAGLNADSVITAYLQQPQGSDVLSVVRKQISDFLLAQGNGATYAQQLGSTAIAAKTLGLLPNTLPVTVVAVTGEEAALSDSYRQMLRFVVRQGTGDADPVILDYSVLLSVVQNERVTLSYIPATVDDQKTVDLFGGLDYVPAYLVKLRAQIKINGQQKAVAQDALATGASHRFEVIASSANGSEQITQTVVAGGYHAVGIYAQQVARVIPANDPADTEYQAAPLLDAIAYHYVDNWNNAEQEIADVMNVAVVHPWPSIAVVSNAIKVDTVLGRPMQLQWQGVTLDAALRVAEPVSRTATATQLKDWMQLTALQGSVLEHQQFESLYFVDSISADKGLALAQASGIPVLSITTANSASLLPTLTQPANVIADISNWLRLGMTVAVPRDPITYKAWHGAIWRVEDPNSGAAGYFIAGGLAGGASAQLPGDWILQWLADALASANTASPNTDPLAGVYVNVVAGDNQQGIVGTELAQPLSVLVRDATGRPVVGATVQFNATAGAGQLVYEQIQPPAVAGAPPVIVTVKSPGPVSALTNVKGIATIRYELGQQTLSSPVYVTRPGDTYVTRAGLNNIDAAAMTRAGPLALTKPFQAYGLPDVPVKLIRTSGCCVGAPLPDGLHDLVSVQTQDQYGNSVSNINVNFTLTQSGANPKGGSNGQIIGDCPTCTGLFFTTKTGVAGTTAGVILGSGYSSYVLTASSAVGSYTNTYTRTIPTFTMWSMAWLDEFGHNIYATRAGQKFAETVSGGLNYFDADANTYGPVTMDSIGANITNGGIVTPPVSTGNNYWTSIAFAGSTPGLNTVSYAAVNVVSVAEAQKAAANNSAPPTPQNINWNVVSFGGLTPAITAVQGQGAPAGIIPLNEDGLTQGPVDLTYTVVPAGYFSLSSEVDILKDGIWDSYSIGSSRTDTGTALLVRDKPFVLNKPYTAQLVLNRGTSSEVRSNAFSLPLRQTIFKDYDRDLHVKQDIDTLNQRVCTLGSEFNFTLTQPATITLVATDRTNANAHTTIFSSRSFPAGAQSVAILPSDLAPGSYTFDLTGVSAIDAHSETVQGGALSEYDIHNSLPVGHTIVKGVDLKDGHLFMNATDLAVPGRGIPLEFRRSYSSSASYKPGTLGTRWSHNYDSKIIITPCGDVIVIGGEGGGMRFVDDGQGGLKPLIGYHGTLIANHTDQTFDFYSKDGTRYHYRLFGGRAQWDLEYIQDANGNLTKLAYDPTSGKVAKLLTVEDAAGRTLKLTYADRTFTVLGSVTPVITQIDGPDGMSVKFDYDNDGNLIKATRDNAARVESYGYSAAIGPTTSSQVLTSYINPNNVTTSYTYNAGQITVTPGGGAAITLPNSYITSITDGVPATTGFSYDTANWLGATVTDANQHTTRYAFNPYGSPLTITDPVGTTTMTWASNDIVMTSKTNARLVKTDYSHDGNGNVLTETVDGKTTTYTYETFASLPIKNRIKTKTDRNLHATTFTYDARGNLVAIRDPEGGTARHFYAGNGDRVQTTDPNGNITRFTYDIYGYLESLTDAHGGITTTLHNIRGLPIKITDARQHATTLTYDTLNRLLSKTDPRLGVRAYTYDNLGNKLTETDEERRITSWTYDGENRVKTLRNPDNKTKTLDYDGVGNKLAESDWQLNTTTYIYDAANRVTSRTEPLGKVTTFSYDAVGNVLSETDALTRLTQYEYDALNRRTRKTDALLGVTNYAYDGVGNKTAETDPLTRLTQFSYDGLNRLTRRTDALSGVTQYQYDANSNRITEIDALNHTRRFSYDALNRLSKRTDANGFDTNLVYDAVGNVITEVNARLFATTHRYDELNRRIYTTDPASAITEYGYDRVGNRTTETWPNANVVRHVYDVLNRLISTTDNLGLVAAYGYDANGNRTSETDARNHTTTKTYDALNRLIQVDMPEARTLNYGYDLVGNKTRETDARRNATLYDYDALNRMITLTDPLTQRMQYTYDAVGNKRSDTDKRRNVTRFDYDALNRLTTVTDPLTQVMRFSYDAIGNKLTDTDKRNTTTVFTYDNENRLLTTTKAGVTLQTRQYDEVGNLKFDTDANGNISTFIYDGRNLLLTESHPQAAISNYQYDAIGNRTRADDPEHRLNTWTYDARRRVTTETNGENETTTYTYDGNGNRLTQQRPKLNTWTSVYDTANRVTSITDPLLGVTRYTYDPNNNRVSQTDANTNTTTYDYDVLNRQTAMVYADTARVVFGYDANNNRIDLTDAKGQVFSYVFDDLNRETQKHYPLPAAPTGDDLQTIVNSYDPNGNLTQVGETYSGVTGTRTTKRSYDAFDRVTGTTDGFGKTLRYQYDANGNRTALTDPDNTVTRYTFDALNRVNTVTNGGGITSYDYDRSSLKTKVTYPNGTTATNTYDRARRMLSLLNRQGVAPVSSYTYIYDPNGNRTQQIETNGGAAETTTYGFDNNDRLTQVTYPDKITTYTFDSNANRLTEITTANSATTLNKTYAYNNRNQLAAVTDNLAAINNVSYTFDANGNQVSKTQGTTVTNFSYDVKDQLLRVNQNATNVGVFAYDYQGRRIVKDMGGAIVRYSYDGTSVLVETDNTGTTLAKFDYGPDRLLSMNHATEGRAYYLFDALGSVSNLMNTAGAIQARYQYDAFGNYRAQAGSSFNRFAFTGHEKDNETNLYYFKARFYDPETGRFLNQDAYLGDVNTPPSLHRYLYAYSNPTVWVDLTGYEAWLYNKEEDIPYGANYKVYDEKKGTFAIVDPEVYGSEISYNIAVHQSTGEVKHKKPEWWNFWSDDVPYYKKPGYEYKTIYVHPELLVENDEGTTTLVNGGLAPNAEAWVERARLEREVKQKAVEAVGEASNKVGEEVSEFCMPACGGGLGKMAAGAILAKGSVRLAEHEIERQITKEIVKDANKALRPRFVAGTNGRLESVFAKIEPRHIGAGSETNSKTRLFARSLGEATDDAGHAIGKNLGGSGTDITNIIPQAPSINRGAFSQFEQQISREVKSGKEVFVRVVPKYESAAATRPSEIVYQVRINGETITRIFNNP
jgi:RHS repeat-associated protein